MSRVPDPLAVSFINSSKAFDSIHLPSLWRILLIYGVPEKVVKEMGASVITPTAVSGQRMVSVVGFS